MTSTAEEELLHPLVRRWMEEQHWQGLRPMQAACVRPILERKTDLVVCASTAAGKTEAAFLPACSSLAFHPCAGTGILYMSPLKALINDQFRRLRDLCRNLRIPVAAWHGDISWEAKRIYLENPSGILLATPESIETFLMRRGGWCHEAFANLHYIVVDEFHAFATTERGRQLQSLMHRIDRTLHRKVPRVALSATIGRIEDAREALRPGGGFPCEVIGDGDTSLSPDVEIRGYRLAPFFMRNKPGGRDAVERMHDDLFQLLHGGHHLVFTNSRAQTEEIAKALSSRCKDLGCPNEFFPHHGTLSQRLRAELELRLKEGETPTTAICTKTLELGIDLGRVDSIAQISAPNSVSGLRQRLGRAGRRGTPPLIRIFVSESSHYRNWAIGEQLRLGLFQSLASVRLLKQAWYEPLRDLRPHYSTLVQQVLSVAAQYDGALPSQYWELLCGSGPFPVSQKDFIALLKSMVSKRLLRQDEDRRLVLGESGLPLTQGTSFSTAFRTPDSFTLLNGTQVIGQIPVNEPLQPGERILFAGRCWKIGDIDEEENVITLEPASSGDPVRSQGSGLDIHARVRAEMFALYQSHEDFDYCDYQARRFLQEGRDAFHSLALDHHMAVPWGSDTYLLPWLGDRTVRTICALLRAQQLEADSFDGIISIHGETPMRCKAVARKIVQQGRPSPIELLRHLPSSLHEKFGGYVPVDLKAEDLLSRFFNIDRAWNWISRLATGGAPAPVVSER